MLKVDFVKNLPVRKFVVVAGLMPLPILVGESATCIPSNEAVEVVA